MKRVITYPVKNRYGESHKAEVKGDGVRVVVGTFESAAEAVAAGREYIRTGVKPPARKRGRRPLPPDQKKPRARAKWTPRPKPTPPTVISRNPDRLAMLKQLAQAHL